MPALPLRLLIGLLGLLALGQTGHLWLDPHAAGATLGLADQGLTGLATLRADIGGIFGGMGVLMLYGAVRTSPGALMATQVMAAVALTGRVVAALHDGFGQAQIQPMVIETIILCVLEIGRRTFRKA